MRFLKYCIISFVSLIMISCNQEDYMEELQFNISLNEISDFSATITVNHTGTNRDVYYAFVVQGEISDINAEIQKHLSQVLSGTITEELYNQKKRVIKLSELIPETQYTCIVYGLNDTNEIIGIPSSTVFTTKSSSIVFSINPLWKLTYLGQSKYDDKTYSKINIRVDGDVKERYFVRVYNKEEMKDFSDIRNLLLHAYTDFNSERNELNDEYFWIESNYVRTGSTNYYKYLFKGEYQAFAIGVNANGELTGSYACSEIFDFDGYDLDPDYASLLGDWILTDGVGGEIYFTMSEKWANSSLSMSGFGYVDCPLVINYTPNSNFLLTIGGQSVNGKAWGEDETQTMTLRGWYYNEDGNFQIYTSKIISTLARSKARNDDESYTFTSGFNITLDNGNKAETVGVVLTTYKDGKYSFYNSSKIQLPFTMRKY